MVSGTGGYKETVSMMPQHIILLCLCELVIKVCFNVWNQHVDIPTDSFCYMRNVPSPKNRNATLSISVELFFSELQIYYCNYNAYK